MIGMRIWVALLALLMVMASGMAEAGDQGWKSYRNDRFGYTICYPAALLQPQPEADDGDGRVFKTGDGVANLTVWGGNDVSGQSLKTYQADYSRDLVGQTGAVTYKAAGKGWAVVSGRTSDGDLFYLKTLRADDQFKSFQLTYAGTKSAVYDPVAAKLSQCFKNINAASAPR